MYSLVHLCMFLPLSASSVFTQQSICHSPLSSVINHPGAANSHSSSVVFNRFLVSTALTVHCVVNSSISAIFVFLLVIFMIPVFYKFYIINKTLFVAFDFPVSVWFIHTTGRDSICPDKMAAFLNGVNMWCLLCMMKL